MKFPFGNRVPQETQSSPPESWFSKSLLKTILTTESHFVSQRGPAGHLGESGRGRAMLWLPGLHLLNGAQCPQLSLTIPWQPGPPPARGRGTGSQGALLGRALGSPSISLWTRGTRQRDWDEPFLSWEDIGGLGGQGIDGLHLGVQMPPQLGKQGIVVPAQRGSSLLVLHLDYGVVSGLRHGAQRSHQALPQQRWLGSPGPGSGLLPVTGALPLGSVGAGVPRLLAAAAVASIRPLSSLFNSHPALLSQRGLCPIAGAVPGASFPLPGALLTGAASCFSSLGAGLCRLGRSLAFFF